MEPLSEYQYFPLQHPNSIRLLSLHPAEEQSPIHISLSEVRLQDAGSYEALSYSWATEDGDCERSSQIICSGASIYITKNCEAALRRLRDLNSERTLWVDAICINQGNDGERGHQVGIMRDIYSHATQTLIWLGEASKGRNKETNLPVSTVFLEFLGQMASEIRDLKDTNKDPTSSAQYQKFLHQIDVGSKDPSPTSFSLRRGLWSIARRRWWKRLWVVQEVALAKSATLICGPQTANYADFHAFYDLIESRHDPRCYKALSSFDNDHHLYAVFFAKRITSHSDNYLSVLNLLLSVRELQASNPLDRVFEILGLSDHCKATLPSPDYSQSSSQLFTEVTTRFLKLSKSLYILFLAASIDNSMDQCPSWVVDWSKPRMMAVWNIDKVFGADRKSESTFAISEDQKELYVKGVKVDYVERISLAALEAYSYSPAPVEKRVLGWQASCNTASLLKACPTAENVQEALWRTLCWNYDPRGHNPASIKTSQQFEDWHRTLINDQAHNHARPALGNLLFSRLVNNTTPVCVTSKGFLAAVPWTAEAGDCISVLAGGYLPFVLRPMGDYYRLVGPCYVHGIMNGETWPEDENDLESFSIR
ncbi:hypothetical protein EG329_005126 [Mollisiaceae sp. DMI_Dod_QoI]|nr:hypothetical protein EG329_005126 [Helotiales sp. DMI_Dod_QoI]